MTHERRTAAAVERRQRLDSLVKVDKRSSGVHGLPKSETIYVALRGAIVSGHLRPGNRLREVELGRQFRASRTPVREALKKLEAEELVASGSHGLEVARPSKDEIFETYEVREALGVLAMQLAVHRATDADLSSLRMLLERSEEMSGAPTPRAIEITLEFDAALWRASKNRRLDKLLTDLRSRQNRFRESPLLYPGRLKDTVAEHRALLEALQDRDADRGTRLWIEHMQKSRDTRIKMNVENRPSSDEDSITPVTASLRR